MRERAAAAVECAARGGPERSHLSYFDFRRDEYEVSLCVPPSGSRMETNDRSAGAVL